MEENHPKKACEFDSQTETSVYMDESRRGTINEGYLVDISVEDNDMKTFSNVDRINDGHFSHQLPVINEEEERGQDMFENIQNHEEASLGLTRFNNDGSVDTRFWTRNSTFTTMRKISEFLFCLFLFLFIIFSRSRHTSLLELQGKGAF